MTEKTRTRMTLGKTGLAAVLLFVCASTGTANEVSAVWTRLYARAVTFPQKQQIMMNIVEQHSRDMVPVLIDALDQEIRNFRNTTSLTEKTMQIDLMTTIVKELGRLKATESQVVVMETVKNAEDPILKGEAILTLGKIGARQYAGELALMLRNLNFNMEYTENQRENEIEAYALVRALERLRSEDGFEPVFFASLGWYSSQSGVKERAGKAMVMMVDDPTDQLLDILLNNPDYTYKLAALEAEERSAAPEDRKADVAAAALDEGLKYSPKNLTERSQLKTLRLYAMAMMKKYPQPDDPQLLTNMERMIALYRADRVFQEDEMITLMETMGTFSGEETAGILSNFLAYYNMRRDAGPPDSYRIVRSLIQALGSVGHISGLEELTMVTISDAWEASVRREAFAAIEKIKP